MLCEHFPEFKCITTRCPVRDSLPYHPVALCKREDCGGVVISCSRKHSPEEVIEAIIRSLDPKPKLTVI